MQEFHGNLLIGGLALRNLGGVLEGDADNADSWQGRFEIDPCQMDVLETGRQYLLMLNDGRNHEVVLTEIQAADESGTFVCLFEDCLQTAKPK